MQKAHTNIAMATYLLVFDYNSIKGYTGEQKKNRKITTTKTIYIHVRTVHVRRFSFRQPQISTFHIRTTTNTIIQMHAYILNKNKNKHLFSIV